MHPTLISVGPFTLQTYGLFVALGLVAGLLVTVKLARNQGVLVQQVLDMAFIAILLAIVGSRMAYVSLNAFYFASHPLETLKIWEGGLVFHGGLVLAALGLAWYARRSDLSFLDVGDLWAPGAALGQAIGRIGCLMAGCCYGKWTEAPWGVVFSHPASLAPLGVTLHPTQLYASLCGFVLFMVLMLLRKREGGFKGRILLWYLILHSLARLLVERFRGDARGMVPGTEMSLTQLGSLFILLAAVGALMVLRSKARETPPAA